MNEGPMPFKERTQGDYTRSRGQHARINDNKNITKEDIILTVRNISNNYDGGQDSGSRSEHNQYRHANLADNSLNLKFNIIQQIVRAIEVKDNKLQIKRIQDDENTIDDGFGVQVQRTSSSGANGAADFSQNKSHKDPKVRVRI